MICAHAQMYEIDASPFSTEGAPLPQKIQTFGEKVILVDPMKHNWGAYDREGKLVRWGIATTGSNKCADSNESCRTATGVFRIFSLGGENCMSNKYDNAPMPYCMYFNGGEAVHGSTDVQFANASHGCVRVHIDDAKWLRYHFVEGPTAANSFRGTKVIIKPYLERALDAAKANKKKRIIARIGKMRRQSL
jgi:hypothetical protein